MDHISSSDLSAINAQSLANYMSKVRLNRISPDQGFQTLVVDPLTPADQINVRVTVSGFVPGLLHCLQAGRTDRPHRRHLDRPLLRSKLKRLRDEEDVLPFGGDDGENDNGSGVENTTVIEAHLRQLSECVRTMPGPAHSRYMEAIMGAKCTQEVSLRTLAASVRDFIVVVMGMDVGRLTANLFDLTGLDQMAEMSGALPNDVRQNFLHNFKTFETYSSAMVFLRFAICLFDGLDKESFFRLLRANRVYGETVFAPLLTSAMDATELVDFEVPKILMQYHILSASRHITQIVQRAALLELMTTSPTVDMPRLFGDQPLSFTEIVHQSTANISCITQRRNGVMALANATIGSTMIVGPDEADVMLTPGDINDSSSNSKRPRLEQGSSTQSLQQQNPPQLPNVTTNEEQEEEELRSIMLTNTINNNSTTNTDPSPSWSTVVVPDLDTAESLVLSRERMHSVFVIPTNCKINSPLILGRLHSSSKFKYERKPDPFRKHLLFPITDRDLLPNTAYWQPGRRTKVVGFVNLKSDALMGLMFSGLKRGGPVVTIFNSNKRSRMSAVGSFWDPLVF